MKTNFKTFTVVVALGIFGLATINATAGNKSKSSAIVVSEAEKSLTIESWMLKSEFWEARSESNLAESEKALEVEAWMLADEKFLAQFLKEQKLEIEPWMTDVALFSSAESFSESGVACKSMKYIHSHRSMRHRN
ncbi:MAG: hypothetical protein Q7J86_14995 [Bacteroidota bacterium]|nr:hypothetical protein [Bacteroidota bacterium]MDO9615817.1 hypothetical protein [Bacteroidota bacterium]